MRKYKKKILFAFALVLCIKVLSSTIAVACNYKSNMQCGGDCTGATKQFKCVSDRYSNKKHGNCNTLTGCETFFRITTHSMMCMTCGYGNDGMYEESVRDYIYHTKCGATIIPLSIKEKPTLHSH